MKIIRNILIILLAAVLAACGYGYYKSRPLLTAYKELSSAESFDYTVRLFVDTEAAENSGTGSSDTKLSDSAKSFLFAMMENNGIFLEGEYAGQVLHCECSSGTYEDSILEFWYKSDAGNDETSESGTADKSGSAAKSDSAAKSGTTAESAADSAAGSTQASGELTLNLTPTIKCMLTKLASANSFTAMIMGKLTANLSDMVITDTQMNEITGRQTLPDMPEIPSVSTKELILASFTHADVESKYFDSDDLAGKKYISFTTEDGENVTIGISDVTSDNYDSGTVDSMQLYVAMEIDGYPCEAIISLTMPSSEESITVPENQLTEEQLQLFGKIYQAVAPYLQ